MNIVEELGTKTKGLLCTYILYIFVQLYHILSTFLHKLKSKHNAANRDKSVINLRKD